MIQEFHATRHEIFGEFYDDFAEFIWKNFSRAGYVTAYAEDRPDIHLFNFLGKMWGFARPPVDFYLRPYWVAVEETMLKRRSSAYCYNTHTVHALQLGIMKE